MLVERNRSRNKPGSFLHAFPTHLQEEKDEEGAARVPAGVRRSALPLGPTTRPCA